MKTKEEKRAEAVERQAVHDGLSPLDKLTKASSRRGFSVREKARVLSDIYDAALDEFD